ASRRHRRCSTTACSIYGAICLSRCTYIVLDLTGKVNAADVLPSLGWFLLAFAIFNTYMLLWSARINTAVFGVFLTLEITEILLFLGFFSGSDTLIKAGGYMGIITALVAWYTSAADVISNMAGRPVWPVGQVVWKGGRRRP